MTEPVVTQVPINVVYDAGASEPRLSQIPINVVYLPEQPAAISQIPINVVYGLRPFHPAALIPVWPIVEEWEWLTTISKAGLGKEQRMLLREEPILYIDYDLPVLDDENRIRLYYYLHRFIGETFSYPLFQYVTSLNSQPSPQEQTLYFDPTETNIRPGEKVAVFLWDMSFYEFFDVISVHTYGCDVEYPFGLNIPEDALIAPAPEFRIDDNQSFSMGVKFGRITLQLRSIDQRALLRPDENASLETFDGLPVLSQKFTLPSDDRTELSKNLLTADNSLNAPYDKTTWLNPQEYGNRQFLIDDKSELDYWRLFGDTIKGRREAFLLPTFRDDFSLSEVPALGATILVTEDNYIADLMFYNANRYIRLETANGVIFRKVADAILRVEDMTVDIVLATAIGSNPGDNNISKISIVQKGRLNSERISISHHQNYSIVSFSFATVNE